MKTAMIPKMLPWLARRADVSDQRAEALWRTACRQAALTTGEQDGSRYWGVALQNLLDSLTLERWHTHPLLAWPWLLMRDRFEHCAALTQKCLAPVSAALCSWQIGAHGGRPGQPLTLSVNRRSSATDSGAAPWWAACVCRTSATGEQR